MSYWNASSDRDWERYEADMDLEPTDPWRGVEEQPFDAVGCSVFAVGSSDPERTFMTERRAHEYATLRCAGMGDGPALAQLDLRDRERRCGTCQTWFSMQSHNHGNHCDRCIREIYIPAGLWCEKCGPTGGECRVCK